MAAEAQQISAAIFASGTGTNAANIMDHAASSAGALRITRLICDVPGASVIAKAEQRGVPVSIIPLERTGGVDFGTARRKQERRILEVLQEDPPDWIFLAGFMRILSPEFLERFRSGRIINIHPSLLPAFPGRDGYGDAFAAGVRQSGVTIHFVDEGIDTGQIILQKRFERREDDTLEDFRKRGLALEYEAYREVIDMIIQQKLQHAMPRGPGRMPQESK